MISFFRGRAGEEWQHKFQPKQIVKIDPISPCLNRRFLPFSQNQNAPFKCADYNMTCYARPDRTKLIGKLLLELSSFPRSRFPSSHFSPNWGASFLIGRAGPVYQTLEQNLLLMSYGGAHRFLYYEYLLQYHRYYDAVRSSEDHHQCLNHLPLSYVDHHYYCCRLLPQCPPLWWAQVAFGVLPVQKLETCFLMASPSYKILRKNCPYNHDHKR